MGPFVTIFIILLYVLVYGHTSSGSIVRNHLLITPELFYAFFRCDRTIDQVDQLVLHKTEGDRCNVADNRDHGQRTADRTIQSGGNLHAKRNLRRVDAEDLVRIVPTGGKINDGKCGRHKTGSGIAADGPENLLHTFLTRHLDGLIQRCASQKRDDLTLDGVELFGKRACHRPHNLVIQDLIQDSRDRLADDTLCRVTRGRRPHYTIAKGEHSGRSSIRRPFLCEFTGEGIKKRFGFTHHARCHIKLISKRGLSHYAGSGRCILKDRRVFKCLHQCIAGHHLESGTFQNVADTSFHTSGCNMSLTGSTGAICKRKRRKESAQCRKRILGQS